MAVRTTFTQVELLLKLHEEVDEDGMAPFIATANSLVTSACGESNYSDELLELIERWLSAHLYTVREPLAISEKLGQASANYQLETGKGFDSTEYGRIAMRLDTTGGLASIDKQDSKVDLVWLGEVQE